MKPQIDDTKENSKQYLEERVDVVNVTRIVKKQIESKNKHVNALLKNKTTR